MDVNKLRKKQNMFRCLKTISYLLGYPLFIVLVLVGSMTLFHGGVYSDTKWNGVLVALVAWVVAIIAQIVISIITKSYNGRTIGMVIVSLIMLIGASVVFDIVATKKIDEIAEEYQTHGVSVRSYKYQVGWVTTWTDKEGLASQVSGEISQFCSIYNVGYKAGNYGDVNGDGSEVTYDKEADAFYSPNGMFADGYIFGFKQAVNVLIDYHESKRAIENKYVEPEKDKDGNVTKPGHYEPNGKDADEELTKAMKALDSDPDWIAYKNSDEYQAAYGENGSAYTFMLNEERLNKLLGALGNAIIDTKLLNGVTSLLQLAGIQLSPSDFKDLTLDSGLALIQKVVGSLGVELNLEKQDLLDLLQNFSYYQSPVAKPKFDFLKDENLKKYAYANYYATVHGANVGSVLIAKDPDGKIGKVTMSDAGYPNSFAYSLDRLYDLQAKDKVANSYYPFMIARRYALICSGIIAFTTILFYIFKRREDETFEEMVETTMGGRI